MDNQKNFQTNEPKKLKDVMNPNVVCMDPATDLRAMAQKMRELDCGSIPICENDRLVGMVTDRDIVLRGLAGAGELSEICARDVMSSPVIYGMEEESVDDATLLMEARQIRRLLVLNREKRLVGIVAVHDLVERATSEELVGELLTRVCEGSSAKAA